MQVGKFITEALGHSCEMFHPVQGALCLQNLTWKFRRSEPFFYCSILRPAGFAGLVMPDPLTSFDQGVMLCPMHFMM